MCTAKFAYVLLSLQIKVLIIQFPSCKCCTHHFIVFLSYCSTQSHIHQFCYAIFWHKVITKVKKYFNIIACVQYTLVRGRPNQVTLLLCLKLRQHDESVYRSIKWILVALRHGNKLVAKILIAWQTPVSI